MKQLRDLDDRVWRTATWTSPFTVQLVLGAIVGIAWWVGKYAWSPHGFGQYAIGATTTLLLSVAISGVLYTRGSFRAQGMAISIVGSFVVAVVGATAYGFWIVGW
ncbi:hypothetical protein [Mycolicibacterium sp.]|uniref:hypothetical protein n=1 Tax=Mycolicibacterium sp. TaxID=2320850 RepID=UPI001A30A290|nr:hypothetical protein [Mycolicibacterium sp.]MBJ7339338.1 hypothetical protein [Mycolicibacterium sp.]